jgi:hypothetical protein
VLKVVPLPFTIKDCCWVDPAGRLKTRDEGLATGPVTVDPVITETLIVWELAPFENRPPDAEREIVPVQVAAPATRLLGITLTVRVVAVVAS